MDIQATKQRINTIGEHLASLSNEAECGFAELSKLATILADELTAAREALEGSGEAIRHIYPHRHSPRSESDMTLVEKLNKIGIVGDAMSITFQPSTDSEGADADDISADDAREYIMVHFASMIECLDHEALKQLCVYTLKLFDAIDNHDADPSGHDLNG